MRPHSLSGGHGFNPFNWGRHFKQSRRNIRANASGAQSGTSNNSYFNRVKGFQGAWNAAVTSGTMSALGDSLAQYLTAQDSKFTSELQEAIKGGDFAALSSALGRSFDKVASKFDIARSLRMFGFGFFWYGPYQYYWYNLLDWLMPVRNTANFLLKVSANQLLLAPCTLSAVFSWNLTLMGQAEQIPDKIKRDLLPTAINGWKFWIPAASINFYFIPVQFQVLYMSTASVLWTAYLSYASVSNVSGKEVEAAPAPAGKKGKK